MVWRGRRVLWRFGFLMGLSAVLGGLTACHSAYVEADLRNGTSRPITLVELDYPSASFGTGKLESGATFHYRFKVLGNGVAKVLWTDDARHDHVVSGPELHEGQEGTLLVTITDSVPEWTARLRP